MLAYDNFKCKTIIVSNPSGNTYLTYPITVFLKELEKQDNISKLNWTFGNDFM